MSKRSALTTPTSNPTTPKKHKKGERDEVNELDQVQTLNTAVKHIGNQIEEVQARLKSLGDNKKIDWNQPEQTLNFINHDLKLLMILEEQKQFFLQKIGDLNEMNNSPKQVMEQVMESQKIFDEFKNEFNVGAVSNFADLFDLLEMLNKLEKINGPEFKMEMGKQEHELEKMDDPESPWEWYTHEQSEDTARREEIEMRRGIEKMREEILKYIHTMHLEQELQELPELIELDDEYTMPESLDTHEFSYLATDDRLYGDDFDALFHFQEHQVENLEDELMQKQEKEIQELRDELEKMDESKSGELMLRL